MKTNWRAELEACVGFTEKQKGFITAKLLACEEQGGDTDTAFLWIKTALEVQRDGAEVSLSQVSISRLPPRPQAHVPIRQEI